MKVSKIRFQQWFVASATLLCLALGNTGLAKDPDDVLIAERMQADLEARLKHQRYSPVRVEHEESRRHRFSLRGLVNPRTTVKLKVTLKDGTQFRMQCVRIDFRSSENSQIDDCECRNHTGYKVTDDIRKIFFSNPCDPNGWLLTGIIIPWAHFAENRARSGAVLESPTPPKSSSVHDSNFDIESKYIRAK